MTVLQHEEIVFYNNGSMRNPIEYEELTSTLAWGGQLLLAAAATDAVYDMLHDVQSMPSG